ncbi:hypothetical protein QBZ16_001008 [Prototheca wickerhamii]|uniref:Rab-GAP TBC domain-containing protein n=1 Tax=Prototheca wickerhamii TaxID=3111 RepID=A0AAD9IHX5_PROWI|nr:hypothetical protein QBZ16_001008 [Prototheca wickerhamii]
MFCKALAVGLGFGVAAVAGVAVGVLFSANALTIAAATRQRAKPALCEADLEEDAEGRILNWRSALRVIQQRGITPSLRERLWPILLGVFSPLSTSAEREAELRRLHARGAARRGGDGRGAAAAAFAEAHRIVVLDALRSDMRSCDRAFDPGADLECVPLAGFAEEDEEEGLLSDLMLVRHGAAEAAPESASPAPGAAPADYDGLWCSAQTRDALGALSPRHRLHVPRTLRLIRVLSAYAVHDPETGYCQGMADLASVVVQLVRDEALAFACFERVMRSARANFRHDERGIRQQLARLAAIVADTEQELYARLAALGAADCMFAYRMVVVLLRRELPLEEVLLVWEAAWAHAAARPGAADGVPLAPPPGLPRKPSPPAPDAEPPDFVLQFIAAAIRGQKREILTQCHGTDDVLRLFSRVQIDFWVTFVQAQKQYKAYSTGPSSLRAVS